MEAAKLEKIELIDFLELAYNNLDWFANPDNLEGFVRYWAIWVLKNWGGKNYFDTNTVDLKFDISDYPIKTENSLKDYCKTYADFINANTGQSKPTYAPGAGMACQDYTEILSEMFGDIMFKEINKLSEQYSIAMPHKYEDELNSCENVSDIILGQFFDHSSDKELYDAGDKIIMSFGVLGDKLGELGYTPEYQISYDKGEPHIEGYNRTWCSELTLEEIKKMVII